MKEASSGKTGRKPPLFSQAVTSRKDDLMRLLSLIPIVLILLIVGCDQANILKKMTPPEAESIAKGYVDLLRQIDLMRLKRILTQVFTEGSALENGKKVISQQHR